MRCGLSLGLVGSLGLTLACAGKGAKDDGSVALPETCQTQVASTNPLRIDDFEDGDLLLAADQNLHGLWYLHNDGTGTQTPTADDQRSARALIDEPGSDQSPAHALHTMGAGFSGWGAFVATRLNAAQARVCSVDLSAYSALTLSVRGTGRVRFNLGTRATTPVADGGVCNQEACSDYGASIDVSDEWRDITVSLASLSQPDWATLAPFAPAESLRLSFWAESPDFDLWLDDIRLRQ